MVYIVPTIHPANVLRGHKPYTDVIRSDLDRARRISETGFHCPEQFVIAHPSNPIGYIEATRLAILWLDHWLKSKTRVAVDVETSSLDFFNCRLHSIAVSGEDEHNAAVAFTLIDLHTLPWDAELALVAKLREVLEHCPLIFHNSPFDTAVLHFKGFKLNEERDDTMALHHIVQPDNFHTLDWVAQTYLDIPPWKIDHKGKKKAYTSDVIELLVYNARDAITTQRLRKKLYDDVLDRGMSAEVIHWQNEFAKLATELEIVGLPINMAKRKAMGEELKTSLVQQEHAMREYLQWPAFNPMNKNHAVTALYDKKYLGLMPTAWTEKSGQPSTKYEHLVDHMEHPFVRLFIAYTESHHIYAGQYRDAPQADGDPQAGCYFRAIRSDGRLHPQVNSVGQKGTRFSTKPNCFDALTEVLTDRGWKLFPEAVQRSTELLFAQYDPETEHIDFTKATETHEYTSSTLLNVQSAYVNIRATPDHRVLLREYNPNICPRKAEVVRLDELPLHRRFVHAGKYAFGPQSLVGTNFIRLLVACQADGSWQNNGLDFDFKKKGKYERLRKLLMDNEIDNYSFRERPEALKHRYQVRILKSVFTARILHWIGITKTWGSWLLQLSREEASAFLDEIKYWDGRRIQRQTKAYFYYYSKIKENADWVQITALLLGFRAHVLWAGSCWRTAVSESKAYSTGRVSKEVVAGSNFNVYCISVPKGFILTRREGKAVIIGNCQNQRVREREFVEAPPGRCLVASDKEALELRLVAVMAGVPELLDIIRNPDGDPHAFAASFVYGNDFINGTPEKKKMLRDGTKTTVYAGLYGAGPHKIWQSIRRKKFLPPSLRARLTEQEVRKIIRAYFGRYPQIPAFHDRNYEHASKYGYVETVPLGRRRWFPISPPPYTEIANWPIQTAGSDIVTMEMVKIQYELKRRFKDAFIILHGHDQVVAECNEGDAPTIKVLIDELFGNTFIDGPAGPCILTAKAKIGKNLKEVK